MAHIQLPPDSPPGIVGLFAYRPETARPIAAMTEAIMRGPSPLSRGERELIAAYVSHLNACKFCEDSHACFASLQLPKGMSLVNEALANPEEADLSPKMKALLGVAGLVVQGGLSVTAASIEAARKQGATDVEIHDAVLVAAAFCMFNRYVDGLGTFAPPDRAAHMPAAEIIAERGYVAVLEGPPPGR